MGRKKLNLQWISNNAIRRATFNKRRQALIKKTSELATLCGVKVCVVVYGENQARPEVWPSVPEAKNLLAGFKATEGLQQWNKKTSHEDFLKKRISKLQEQVGRSDCRSQGRETSILFHESMAGRKPAGLVGVTPIDAIRLREVVDRKTKAVKERLQQLGVQPEQPLPHAWSSMTMRQPQVPHGPRAGACGVESQRHQQDMLMGVAPDRMELRAVVSGTSTGNSSSAGPSTASTSGGGVDIVQF